MSPISNFFASKLSALSGPIRQLAFVPQDFDRAINFWTTVMGVGPSFHLEHIPLQDVRYRGNPIKYDSSAAISYWGDLEIELLRQHNHETSILTAWLNGERNGIHHVRVQVQNLNEARELYLSNGAGIVQEATLPGGGQYVMFEMPGFESFIEVSVLHPRFVKLFAYMKRTAGQWDGRNPLRSVPPERDWDP